MKKIEKALLPGEKAFFPSENAHFLVESPLFFEGHKPLPWENQSNLCTGNGSLDKPHSNSLALSNGRMILNSESATKFCQINCVAVSMFYILFLWGWRARVKSRIPRNDLFFLKRLKFPEATKIIAFSRNAQKKSRSWGCRYHGVGKQILICETSRSRLLAEATSNSVTFISLMCRKCWVLYRSFLSDYFHTQKHQAANRAVESVPVEFSWSHNQNTLASGYIVKVAPIFWEPEIVCCCRSLICKIALRHCRKTSRWWGGARWRTQNTKHNRIATNWLRICWVLVSNQLLHY